MSELTKLRDELNNTFLKDGNKNK